uniref:CSON013421 protein n=1 Tax=Culicoides sonorensis TaxID=179676 RepID=A0A336MBZ1_CULSO
MMKIRIIDLGDLHNGDWIWIRSETDNDYPVIFAAQIIHIDRKGLMLVKDDDKKEHWIKQNLVIKPLHQSSLNTVDDMITLGDLDDFSILRNLHLRYQMKKIYTYTSSMLIAINPYEALPIYTPQFIRHYRNKSENVENGTKNWRKSFQEITLAMQTLNFPVVITQEIFKLLAALLHLGNLTFKATIVQNIDGVELSDDENLTKIARFLGLPIDELEFALTYKTIFVQGEKVVIPISKDQALEGRDAFVKAIYGKIFLFPKYDNVNAFGIQHFAGPVFYESKGFLEKNRDSFSMDLKEVIFQSSNPLLVTLFENDRNFDSNKKSLTLSTQFRNSLDELMKTLGACQPLFIRCIKPNEFKANNLFDKELCLKQLRYSGVLETAKIRKAGYAIRHEYKDFVALYSCLLSSSNSKKARGSERYKLVSKTICDEILSQDELPMNVQFGSTKIFLKESFDTRLRNMREGLYLKSAIIIQRNFRRIIFKRWLLRQISAVITIQRCYRRYAAKRQYLKFRRGIERLQALIRSREAARQYRLLQQRFVHFQSHCRGFLTRKNLHKRVAIQQNKLKLELIIQRRKDEVDFKQNGEQMWREKAQEKYLARLKVLKTNEKNEIEKEKKRVEHDMKIIDDEFSFLNMIENNIPETKSIKSNDSSNDENYIKSYKSPPQPQKKERTIKVKKMMTFFEEQSKIVKKFPHKFLSRPVNTYDSSRL